LGAILIIVVIFMDFVSSELYLRVWIFLSFGISLTHKGQL